MTASLLLQDEYPDVFRFAASVFPSVDDDVVTSPYNAVLAAAGLVEHADCVLPIENQALIDICSRFVCMHIVAVQADQGNLSSSAAAFQAGGCLSCLA